MGGENESIVNPKTLSGPTGDESDVVSKVDTPPTTTTQSQVVLSKVGTPAAPRGPRVALTTLNTLPKQSAMLTKPKKEQTTVCGGTSTCDASPLTKVGKKNESNPSLTVETTPLSGPVKTTGENQSEVVTKVNAPAQSPPEQSATQNKPKQDETTPPSSKEVIEHDTKKTEVVLTGEENDPLELSSSKIQEEVLSENLSGTVSKQSVDVPPATIESKHSVTTILDLSVTGAGADDKGESTLTVETTPASSSNTVTQPEEKFVLDDTITYSTLCSTCLPEIRQTPTTNHTERRGIRMRERSVNR